jgi:hypothetical protein
LLPGTNRTNRVGLAMSVHRVDWKWLDHGQNDAYDPKRALRLTELDFAAGRIQSLAQATKRA